jgi:hypothetical protein
VASGLFTKNNFANNKKSLTKPTKAAAATAGAVSSAVVEAVVLTPAVAVLTPVAEMKAEVVEESPVPR